MPTTTTIGFIGCRLLHEASPLVWDWQTRTFKLERRYHIVGYGPEGATALYYGSPCTPDAIPEYIDLLYPSGNSTVRCMETDRQFAPVQGKDNQCVVNISYEGAACMGLALDGVTWWNGIIGSRYDYGSSTELIVLGYDRDENGARKAIGAQAEGTNRLVPGVLWRIVQNVTESDYQDRFNIYRQLIGRVNQTGWLDPVFGLEWSGGTWLYHAPQATEARAGYVTLTHTLEYSGTDGKFAWYEMEERRKSVANSLGETVSRTFKTAIGDKQVSQIYLYAGLDDTNAPDYTLPTFDDLFCDTTSVTTLPATTTAGV